MKLFDTHTAQLLGAEYASAQRVGALEVAVTHHSEALLEALRSSPSPEPMPKVWDRTTRARKWAAHRAAIEAQWRQVRQVTRDDGEASLEVIDAFIDAYAAHPLGNHRRADAETLRAEIAAGDDSAARHAPMELLKVGQWRFLPHPRLTDAFYLWYGEQADPAVEVVQDANGWWRLRSGTGAWTVYAAQHRRRRALEDRPWERTLPVAVTVTRPMRMSWLGRYGQTVLDVSPKVIQVTLPDGGRLLIAPSSPQVLFTDVKGQTQALP